ncbi:MAG: DUF72 domain-containing protein [Flavobacteriales bacterium]
MKFGRTDLPKNAVLRLPPDHAITAEVLPGSPARAFHLYTGGSKWSLKDLVGPVYPPGTKAKDMLRVYASLFNAIELNATRYGNFPPATWAKWVAETPPDFRFCPKVHQSVAQIRRLQNVEEVFRQYLDSVAHAGDKLGPMLLQMPENFGPEHMDRVVAFAPLVPRGWKLAVEMRHPGWMEEPVLTELLTVLRRHKLGAVITDSPGRRDMVHMAVTAPYTFVRFVSSDDEARDASRLHAWIERLDAWRAKGLQETWFFVHEAVLGRVPRWTAALQEHLGGSRRTAEPTLFDQ